MGYEDKARIVAFARLLGVTGTNQEIFDKYWEYYQAALPTFAPVVKPAEVEIVRREV